MSIVSLHRRSDLRGCRFDQCYTGETFQRFPALRTACEELTHLHHRLVTEGEEKGVSFADELAYTATFASWCATVIRHTELEHMEPSTGLWFPLPRGRRTDVIWAELAYRIYRCTQRLLMRSVEPDRQWWSHSDSVDAVPSEERRRHLSDVRRLIGLRAFLETEGHNHWKDCDVLYSYLGLPRSYRDQLFFALRAYGLWNAALISAADNSGPSSQQSGLAFVSHAATGLDDLHESRNLQDVQETPACSGEQCRVVATLMFHCRAELSKVAKYLPLARVGGFVLSLAAPASPEPVPITGIPEPRTASVPADWLHNGCHYELCGNTSRSVYDAETVQPWQQPWSWAASRRFMVWLARYFRSTGRLGREMALWRCLYFSGYQNPVAIDRESSSRYLSSVPDTLEEAIEGAIAVSCAYLQDGLRVMKLT